MVFYPPVVWPESGCLLSWVHWGGLTSRQSDGIVLSRPVKIASASVSQNVSKSQWPALVSVKMGQNYPKPVKVVWSQRGLSTSILASSPILMHTASSMRWSQRPRRHPRCRLLALPNNRSSRSSRCDNQSSYTPSPSPLNDDLNSLSPSPFPQIQLFFSFDEALVLISEM